VRDRERGRADPEVLRFHFTQALYVQTPHGAVLPAKVAAADHAFLVIAMLAGALVGRCSGMVVTEKTARGQLVSLLIMPFPLIGGIAFGMAIGGHRGVALASFPVFLAVTTYVRRFGARWFACGLLVLIGDLTGFFVHRVLGLGDLGWLAAEIGIGLAVTIVVRFAFFYPSQARALRRTQRSWEARARKVAALALELLDNPRHSAGAVRPLDRQLIRLNEAALMIDGQLADPRAVADGSSAQLLHQRLFDAELALTNIARFARAMAGVRLPGLQHFEARLALHDLVRGDNEAARTHAARLIGLLREGGLVPADEDRAAVVIAHRFAGSVIDLADALTEWEAAGASREGEGAFQSQVRLAGGWLPGSAMVSNAASLERGTGLADRIRLPLYLRSAIQVGIAAGVAVALGDVLSTSRFYWALIAVIVIFMGASSTGEQVHKALYRIAGTFAGIVVGSLLATTAGHHPYWSIAVILAALFFQFYLQRINYAFTAFGVTVRVSLLVAQLGGFSNSVLVTRLEETALGAAVAMAVVLLVFPLHTRRVLHVALRQFVQAVGRLAGHASDHLLGADHDTGTTMRADARAVDAAYQALMAAAGPLRPLGRDTRGALRLASAARNYSRNLIADTRRAGLAGLAGARLRQDIELASVTLRHSVDVVAGALTGSRETTYTRSAAIFDQAERRVEERASTDESAQLAIRDLKLIDGTMAELAEAMGLAITDYDTVRAGPVSPAAARTRGREDTRADIDPA
jgi:uncharacterized membrane protein YgaE (UPF0421/DUF939 family)